jgi:hypothetical protein
MQLAILKKDKLMEELSMYIAKVPNEVVRRVAKFFVMRAKIRHSIAFC